MGWWDDKLQDAFAAITRGMAAAKLGPGVLGTIVPINTVGLVALAALVYALAANPLFALIGLALGLAFLTYANERAFRYAEQNPIPALLGGTELLQLFRDQMASRDKSLIVDQDRPVIGGSVDSVPRKDDGDV
jgi:hypothetical protein